jgi:uncharacterized phage protein (TIGR02220 family)
VNNNSESRKTNRNGFAITPNELLNDPSITMMAKGIYGFMQSKPDAWNFTILSMSKQMKEGVDSIKTSLKQLRDTGWIEYTKNHDGSGHYSILIQPKVEKQHLDSDCGLQGCNNALSPKVEIPLKGKSTRISKKEPLVRKIKDKDIVNEEEPRSQISVEPQSRISNNIQQAFDHWIQVMEKKAGACKLTAKRKSLITARLKEGYTLDDLKQAIEGCRNSKYHRGQNDKGTVYDSIELIFRDGGNVERFRDGQSTQVAVNPNFGMTAKQAHDQELRDFTL